MWEMEREGFAEGDLGSDNNVLNMLDWKKLVTKGMTALLYKSLSFCKSSDKYCAEILSSYFIKNYDR